MGMCSLQHKKQWRGSEQENNGMKETIIAYKATLTLSTSAVIANHEYVYWE